MTDSANVRWFSDLGLADLEQVGGKNSSLGEMVSNLAELGVSVPNGFATTAEAYRRFIGETGLAQRITERLGGLDTEPLSRGGARIKVDQEGLAPAECRAHRDRNRGGRLRHSPRLAVHHD